MNLFCKKDPVLDILYDLLDEGWALPKNGEKRFSTSQIPFV